MTYAAQMKGVLVAIAAGILTAITAYTGGI